MAIVTAQAYEASIIDALAISDPQLNTGLGTPVRKIITAVAQEMANYNVDVNVTSTLYSIESVSGTELDYLVGQFGFTRHEAKPARGAVTIHRDNGDTLYQIDYGTSVYKPATNYTDAVAFQTTAYQEMTEGVLDCEIAIIATEAGSLGNVPANTITYMTSSSEYIFVTNNNPTYGGRDAETDEQLRQRFLLTVFRNVAGTSDQLLGLALANAKVDKANLVGQESRYSETVQVAMLGDDSTITASVSNDKWDLDVDYPLDVVRRYWVRMTETQELLDFSDYVVSLDGKTVTFRPRRYSDTIGPVTAWSSHRLSFGNLVSVSIVDGSTDEVVSPSKYNVDYDEGLIIVEDAEGVESGTTWEVSYKYNFMSEGDFVNLEFDYFSKHNRGGLKTVDLFVDCLSPANVTDIQYADFSKVITEENAADWVHADGTHPTVGHIYVPLSYQPMFSSSGYISMGTSIVLNEYIHYRMIWDDTRTTGSCRGMDAVELLATLEGEGENRQIVFDNDDAMPTLDDDTPIAIPYLHDYPVEDVQSLLDMQRIVTMDVQVHEAKHRYFVIYLSLMYSTFPKDSVIESVKRNVEEWSDVLPFGYTIQLSDIETVAANTPGVDNVRTATAMDAGGRLSRYTDGTGYAPGAYGIVEVQRDGVTFKRQYTNDFWLAENEVFELQEVIVYSKTQQRWGA